jgi:hypothetical protein
MKILAATVAPILLPLNATKTPPQKATPTYPAGIMAGRKPPRKFVTPPSFCIFEMYNNLVRKSHNDKSTFYNQFSVMEGYTWKTYLIDFNLVDRTSSQPGCRSMTHFMNENCNQLHRFDHRSVHEYHSEERVPCIKAQKDNVFGVTTAL